MTERGAKFVPGEVNKWMDCGNPKVTIETNSEVLKLKFPESKVSENAKVENSIIIDPCYIGEGATIKNSVVGPNVTIGPKSAVENCRLENLILQNESSLQNASIKDSMIGNKVSVKLKPQKLNLGDYNTIE
jgi:glucose-1-phosphate thymidylyltransferase